MVSIRIAEFPGLAQSNPCLLRLRLIRGFEEFQNGGNLVVGEIREAWHLAYPTFDCLGHFLAGESLANARIPLPVQFNSTAVDPDS